jgi:hypothetical protein
LRAGVSLLRGQAVKFNRLAEIPLHQLAFVIDLAQAELGCSKPLVG